MTKRQFKPGDLVAIDVNICGPVVFLDEVDDSLNTTWKSTNKEFKDNQVAMVVRSFKDKMNWDYVVVIGESGFVGAITKELIVHI